VPYLSASAMGLPHEATLYRCLLPLANAHKRNYAYSCAVPIAERRCGLTRRLVELTLPSGRICDPVTSVEVTTCSGVCGTSFVEGSIVFAGELASPPLRSVCLRKFRMRNCSRIIIAVLATKVSK